MPHSDVSSAWLVVVGKEGALPALEVDPELTACGRPGMHRAYLGPYGPVCPGCARTCRIPVSAGLARGDEFIVRGVARRRGTA